MEISLEMQSG